MSFVFREDISIADVAIEIEGETLEEIFKSATNAILAIQVAKPEQVEKKFRKKIKIKENNSEKLLHTYLEELVFLKDAKLLLISEIKIKIDNNQELVATLIGDKIDIKKYEMLVDAKAISWHKFSLIKEDKWKAFVIVDV